MDKVKLNLATGTVISSGDAPPPLGCKGSLQTDGGGREGVRRYACRFVQSGAVRGSGGEPSGIEITPGALQRAWQKGLFDGRAVFIDHAALWEYPSLDNLAGVTMESRYIDARPPNDLQPGAGIFSPPPSDLKLGGGREGVGGAVYGVIELFTASPHSPGSGIAALLDELLALGEAAPDVGLSLVFYPVWQTPQNSPLHERSEWGGDGGGGGTAVRTIVDIRHVESIDLVFEPAAGGRLIQALSTLALSAPPSPVKFNHPTQIEKEENEMTDRILNSSPARPAPQAAVQPVVGEETPIAALETLPPSNFQPLNFQPLNPSLGHQATGHPGTGLPATNLWLEQIQRAGAEAMIEISGLPLASRQRLLMGVYAAPEEVAQAIQAERTYLAELLAGNVVQLGGGAPRGGRIAGMRDGLDRLSLALDALLAGVRPPSDIQPLTGIREAYHLLSGDYEMSGMFQPDRVMFANVTCSTMAGLVANALNKRLAVEFAQYPLWWTPFASEEDFNSLQEVKWITLGGVGELPTVSEGASYTELTWDDKTESASFVKKGGYLGITLEAIDKDDVGRLRAAPRALAQAAWLTLSKAISGIFTETSGTGPLVSDGTRLFTSGHANLGSTALSLTSYSAARLAMRKQTELNSSERLGALTAPKYLLVPPDLEITALQVLASEHDYTYALSNGTAAPANAFAEGADFQSRMEAARKRLIVVDLWTDSNDWALVADPRLYATVGVGYRYGRAPEIFSVASPTAGLMFTNDTMPVKVRFFFAAGPMDWRGLYKANVA